MREGKGQGGEGRQQGEKGGKEGAGREDEREGKDGREGRKDREEAVSLSHTIQKLVQRIKYFKIRSESIKYSE